jgi:hypothetical protein
MPEVGNTGIVISFNQCDLSSPIVVIASVVAVIVASKTSETKAIAIAVAIATVTAIASAVAAIAAVASVASIASGTSSMVVVRRGKDDSKYGENQLHMKNLFKGTVSRDF